MNGFEAMAKIMADKTLEMTWGHPNGAWYSCEIMKKFLENGNYIDFFGDDFEVRIMAPSNLDKAVKEIKTEMSHLFNCATPEKAFKKILTKYIHN